VKGKEKMNILGQIFDALRVLVPAADLQEAQAVKLSAFYPIWSAEERYGNNNWLRWSANEDGKPLLWTTTRNIQPGGGAPDVTPGSYRLLG